MADEPVRLRVDGITLVPLDEGPVYPDALLLGLALRIEAGSALLRAPIAVGAVLPSLDNPRAPARLVTDRLLEQVDFRPAGPITGHQQPRWCTRPAWLESVHQHDIHAFQAPTVPLGVRPVLPYVHCFPPDGVSVVINELNSIPEQAYERGSLSGRSVIHGGVYVSDSEGLFDWYQLKARYGSGDSRAEVTHFDPIEPDSLPDVYWGAEPIF